MVNRKDVWSVVYKASIIIGLAVLLIDIFLGKHLGSINIYLDTIQWVCIIIIFGTLIIRYFKK